MRRLAIVALIGALAGCSGEGNTFTLYRNSLVNPNMRVHVATFDTDNSGDYNQENCWQAQKLFAAQEGISTKFWCEKGRYRA